MQDCLKDLLKHATRCASQIAKMQREGGDGLRILFVQGLGTHLTVRIVAKRSAAILGCACNNAIPVVVINLLRRWLVVEVLNRAECMHVYLNWVHKAAIAK